MKKLFLIFSLVLIYLSSNAYSNKVINRDTIPCNEPILDSIESILDSLSLLLLRIKGSLPDENSWVQFNLKIEEDNPASAFEILGNSRMEFESKYIMFHNRFYYLFQQLKNSLEGHIYNVLDKQLCFIDHINHSNIKLTPSNIPEGRIIGPEEPCWSNYSLCKKAARRNRISGWWDCALGGLGISVISGGLGLGLGVACIIQNTNNYNEAVEDCQTTYNNCIAN